MSDELPQGWTKTSLDLLCEKLRGVSYKREEASNNPQAGSLPILRANNIDADELTFSELVWVPGNRISAYQKLRKGDIVVAMSSGSKKVVGKTAQATADWDGSFGAFCGVLRPSPELNSRYIGLFLRTQEYRSKISELAAGTNINNLKNEHFAAIEVPLSPLPEQCRILAKLEQLLGKVDACQKRLAKIPLILKRFRQSVLAAACSGRLTEDWREQNPDIEPAADLLDSIARKRKIAYQSALREATERSDRKPRKMFPDEPPLIDTKGNDLPETWTMTNVGFLAHVTKLAGFEYTKHINLQDVGEVPVVRAQNVQMGRFVLENIKYISNKISDLLERSQLHGREILMVFIGAGTGNVCMAPKEGRWHLAPNVAKIDIDGVNTSYLLFYLQSPIGFSYMTSWIKATAQPSLSMETIREIVVHLPPLNEQTEIVRRVEALFRYANQLESRYQKAKSHVDKLTQSILAKAFRGELVPQDPNDEPASVLLERIRRSRNQEPATRTRRVR